MVKMDQFGEFMPNKIFFEFFSLTFCQMVHSNGAVNGGCHFHQVVHMVVINSGFKHVVMQPWEQSFVSTVA